MNNDLKKIKYKNTNDIFDDVCSIIEIAQNYVYRSINKRLVERNWLIGYRIAEEELKGGNRAEYGYEIIKSLAIKLEKQYGSGFNYRNLYYFFLVL